MNEQTKALNAIAAAIQSQNRLLDEISISLANISEIVRDVALYPADDKQPPRVLVGVAAPVEFIEL